MTGLPASDTAVLELSHLTPGTGSKGLPRVLLEVPHGATGLAHYRAVRERLAGPLPAELEAFFLVNTDVGAPEVARALARRLAAEGVAEVGVLRGLVPRTFADCNRELSVGPEALRDRGLTPAVPPYVTDPFDRGWLEALHRLYLDAAERAYAWACDAGGVAVTLHSYAPRSVQVEAVDGGIVGALRAAYRPEVYRRWPLRPEVDLITCTPEGEALADPLLVEAVRQGYREAGLEVAENGTYRLLPGTQGAAFSRRWPGRVLCLELRRDLLADPFVPFAEVAIPPARVERMAAPLAKALVARVTAAA
jgi:predicted N-formylglutamate amidohydrolase